MPTEIPIAQPIIGEEEKAAVIGVLESGNLAQGEKVAEFEAAFAEYVGSISNTRSIMASNLGGSPRKSAGNGSYSSLRDQFPYVQKRAATSVSCLTASMKPCRSSSVANADDMRKLLSPQY